MIAWLHCPAGASGDMLLGALIDAGAQLEPTAEPTPVLQSIRAAVGTLPVEPIEIRARRVTRQGLAATSAEVYAPHATARRAWADVRALLEEADLAEPVRAGALDVFARLARAEAGAHGARPEDVHFHEVGALDALADVVGTCAALHHLDVTEITCSPVALGTGMARGEHGPLPVPGPAVLQLLREAQAPVYTTDLPYELCTPTGAALLAATVTRWGGMPELRVHAAGAGAGTRELAELPNVTRVVLGTAVSHQEGYGPAAETELRLLETNIDDLDPRLWPAVLDRLLAAGALDAWLTPILMKKGRPAHTLSVLVDHADVATVRRMIYTETSTLGIRERGVGRTVLDRAPRTVDVGGRSIRVKLAYLDGHVVNAQPEYDDVVAVAAALGRSVRDVLAAAAAAARHA